LNSPAKVPSVRVKAVAWDATLIDEELLEVPNDVARIDRVPEYPSGVTNAKNGRRARFLQVREQWIFLISIDVQLAINLQI